MAIRVSALRAANVYHLDDFWNPFLLEAESTHEPSEIIK
jgi:hypothetical protein